MAMNPLLVQLLNNIAIMILSIVIFSFIQRGFFWRFVQVRLSFGGLIMVKIRTDTIDIYRVGKIEEGWLLFTRKKKELKRLKIPKDKPVFYRSMGCLWIDVEDARNTIAYTDHETACAFDPVKYNDLYKRALYKPEILDNKEKLELIILIVIGLVVFYIAYQGYQDHKILLEVSGKVSEYMSKTITTKTL